MTVKLLKKGLEVELFAGNNLGEVLPLSTKLTKHFPGFSQEPDQRNFEYITKPTQDYNILLKEIIEPRIKARKFLKKLGDLTIIPGSTMPLKFKKEFYFSKPGDPYHEFILKTYKTRVITTSLHINIGINDYEKLFKLLCLLRLDAPLFLALSASSCFHDGTLTNYSSYRWHDFPKTPAFVPFFLIHSDYVKWTNSQLKTKKMLNVRHLWTSVRPNGPNRPYNLNRIEVRICDFVSNVKNVLAIVALIEIIAQKYLQEENWPKLLNNTSSKLNDLATLVLKQEEKVSKDGLNAKIWDWRNDSTRKASYIIESLLQNLSPVAKKLDILKYLSFITQILNNGNEASQFINLYKKNNSIQETITHFIREFTIIDFNAYKMIKKQM